MQTALFWILSIFLLAPLTGYAQTKYPFDLPVQSLAESLRAVGHQTSTNVMFEPRLVKGLDAPALRAETTVTEAIRMLLAGTPLTALQTAADTILIQRVSIAENPAPTTHAVAPTDTRLAQAQGESSAVSSDSSQQRTALEEIIVTAQKREERLSDVPVPVTVLSGQTLADHNQLRIRDYFSSVPGLNISPARAQYQTLSIRGISTGVLTNPTVGITVDDMPYGSSSDLGGAAGLPDIDPFDLARIEVLRGPQGSLYGASSMGGLLKFVTVDPSTAALTGRLQADTNAVHNGDGLGYGFRGAVNAPLGDSFAIRVSAFTRKEPGYIDNPAQNREGVNETDARGARVSSLWQPSEAFSLKLSALLQKSESDGHPDEVRLPGFGERQQNYPPGVGANELEVQAYTANVNARLGAVDLVSVTGYNVNSIIDSIDYSSTVGALSLPVFGVATDKLTFDNETRKFSQEIRAALPLGERIRWSIGGFFTDERSTYVQRVLALNPSTGQAVGQGFALDFPTKYRERAVFSDLLFDITDRFDIQVGGRQSHIEQTKNQTQTALFGNQTPVASPEARNSADAFTYLLTPRFRVSPDVMVYARFASGYRTGGSNPNPAHPEYDPDKTSNYEIGVKGNGFSRMLTFDVSVYHIDWRDIQINLRDPVTLLSYTANGGRAKSEGVELSAEIRPWDGMTLSGWVARGNAVLSEALPVNSTAFGPDGARLPLSGKLSGNISFEQQFPLLSSATGFFGAAASFVDDRQGNFQATAAALRAQLPSYTKVDLRAGVRFDSVTVSVFANNVSDERGLIAGGDVTPRYAYTYIQPRTIGLSLSKMF